MTNRGGNNLDYKEGFQKEAEGFIKYEVLLKRLLTASNIELVTRGMLDKECGIDAIARIEKQHYFISLRFRKTNRDYNSFTLSRNIKDNSSEIKKWLTNKVRPDFYIQISETNKGTRVIEVNVDSFNLFVKKLIKDNTLESYYNQALMAYEFSLKDLKQSEHGIRNILLSTDDMEAYLINKL